MAEPIYDVLADYVKTIDTLSAERDHERALADDLAAALNDSAVALIDAGISPPPQSHRALVRHRQARQQ